MGRWIANAVSLTRVALLVPWIACVRADSPAAGPLLVVMVASDVADGAIARRLAVAGSGGALVDASCDALVAVTGTLALGLGDPGFLVLAAIMAGAFLSYAAYSLRLGHFGYTRLGRYDGVISYAVLALASLNPLPHAAVVPFVAAAAVYLLGSTAENLLRLLILSCSRRRRTCLS